MKLNDIVTFKSHKGLVTHRIVGIDELDGTLITKGDHCKYNDDYKVSMRDVEGKVMFSIPFVGFFVKYLHSIQVMISIGLFFMLFIGCSLYEIRGVKCGSEEI